MKICYETISAEEIQQPPWFRIGEAKQVVFDVDSILNMVNVDGGTCLVNLDPMPSGTMSIRHRIEGVSGHMSPWSKHLEDVKIQDPVKIQQELEHQNLVNNLEHELNRRFSHLETAIKTTENALSKSDSVQNKADTLATALHSRIVKAANTCSRLERLNADA